MKNIIKVVTLFITFIFFVGCTSTELTENNLNGKDNSKEAKEEKVQLELWSYYDANKLIKDFEDKNPNIKINQKIIKFDYYIDEVKKGLTEENGPDILIIDSNQYGDFTSIDALEDMSKEQYGILKYKDDYDKDLWELGMSLDKKRLLGLPFASAPLVTYYRADIMEKYGFPSEPNELSKYMENPNNWIKMAKRLKDDGIYMLQWAAEITKIYTADMPYFDGQLKYKRSNEKFKKGIEMAKQVKEKSLIPYTDIWSPLGKEYLQNDKFAMLYLGSWGARELETMVPDQSGKWRVTTLPFGVNGWNNSSIISITKKCANKNVAMDFVKQNVFEQYDKEVVGSVHGYIPFRNNEDAVKKENKFLGGQREQGFYEEVMEKTKEYPVTPFDERAFKLWDRVLNEGLDEEMDSDKIMKNISDEIEKEFSKEREFILEGLKNLK
ncbi:ABC transporter substrate-binding protein [Clostridium sp.]|uniref:ABC transporter substrate-binding protein n=1 Tax=Clostridium sp. TaxID=1506 RepID=UPI002FCACEAD